MRSYEIYSLNNEQIGGLREDSTLFQLLLDGAFITAGFRNKDLRFKLVENLTGTIIGLVFPRWLLWNQGNDPNRSAAAPFDFDGKGNDVKIYFGKLVQICDIFKGWNIFFV